MDRQYPPFDLTASNDQQLARTQKLFVSRSARSVLHPKSVLRNTCISPRLAKRQALITVRMERERLIFATSKAPVEKLIEWSAARGFHEINLNRLFHIIVANFIGKKKVMFKNQVLAMAERTPELRLVTEQTIEETLRWRRIAKVKQRLAH